MGSEIEIEIEIGVGVSGSISISKSITITITISISISISISTDGGGRRKEEGGRAEDHSRRKLTAWMPAYQARDPVFLRAPVRGCMAAEAGN